MKVSDSKKIIQSSKTKKSKKTSDTSFADMISSSSSVEDVKSVSSVASVSTVSPLILDDDFSEKVPNKAEDKMDYMLDKLEELEKAILSGEDTAAVMKLKEALDTQVVDLNKLSPRAKEILEEIELRVSIEVAKMESK